MNLIWIISDTLRRDDVGYYGNKKIITPTMDALAEKSVGFMRHYCASFPTMPARADFLTGRWTGHFMEWGPFPPGQMTLPTILLRNGYTTAGMVDTPFYLRQNMQLHYLGQGMNYDQGFTTFTEIPGQCSLYFSFEGDARLIPWRYESDHFAPQTFIKAMNWLESHYQEDFFLCVDVWDPHEPWDAPKYYTEPYWPGYDGEIVNPVYKRWQDVPGLTEEKVKKGHATYCGEVTMVDTWMGYFLKKVENMGLMDNTAIIFTTDHGFHFGEHGYFGKLTMAEPSLELVETVWTGSPLYEEVAHIPLTIYVPGISPGKCNGLTSAIDIMPTALDILGMEIPDWVEGCSLLPMLKDNSLKERDFVVSGMPFTEAPDKDGAIAGRSRHRFPGWDATITTEEWVLLYSLKEPSELYHLASDPKQAKNVIKERPEVAKELHSLFVSFLKENNVEERFLKPRLTIKL